MRLFIGIGSNLGDRQANVLSALQRLRSRAGVLRVSSFYESNAAGGAEGPAFLNVAAELETALDRQAFERFAHDVEAAVGRFGSRKLAARPIDIDILWTPDFVHPDLEQRLYNAVPLAEIAPHLSGAVPVDGSRKNSTARCISMPTGKKSLPTCG